MKEQAYRHSSLHIAPQRQRLFRIIALTIPILFFALLEFVLRLFHYGPDLSLFKIEIVNEVPYYTLNPAVKNRYFNRINFSPDPSPEYFSVTKPPGAFRIFCLGGSTTVGYPYWYNGAFPAFLRDRLQTLFPERPIEIVNVGMTATNSYTVLDLSKDLLSYEPDLFIVYDGHNEFYGALGVASKARVASARWLTLLYLRFIHLRTFQLVQNGVAALVHAFEENSNENSGRTTLMEQVAEGKNVPYESEAYVDALAVFRENLDALAERCRVHGIPLILGTQASNLRDQPPFISNHMPGISQPQRLKFQQFYEKGLALQAKGKVDSALVHFESAIAVDSFYADAHYRRAQCLEAIGRKRKACSEYIRARDYDELRFRTDSKFNELIRSQADRKHCFVADIEKSFQTFLPDSLIGRNLIFEHLHPNARGQFLMAREYAHMMREHGLLVSAEEWARRDTLSDAFLWEHRHLTAIDEFMAERKIALLTSGWPFQKQAQPVPPIPKTDTLLAIAEQAVHNRIGWITAHERAAEFYLRRGEHGKVANEFETIISQFPHNVDAHLTLARLYYDQKAFAQAEKVLLAALHIKPTPAALRGLGDVYLKQGKSESAIRYYEELAKLPEEAATAPENAYMLALAYLASEKPEPALRILERIIARYPSYPRAKELLTRVRSVEKDKAAH